MFLTNDLNKTFDIIKFLYIKTFNVFYSVLHVVKIFVSKNIFAELGTNNMHDTICIEFPITSPICVYHERKVTILEDLWKELMSKFNGQENSTYTV